MFRKVKMNEGKGLLREIEGSYFGKNWWNQKNPYPVNKLSRAI